MKATCQHRIIAKHLQHVFGHLHDWPFCSFAEIEDELCSRTVVLSAGDYLIVGLGGNDVRCGTASSLQGLADFPADSLVIPYHELERAFHETHAEHVEL